MPRLHKLSAIRHLLSATKGFTLIEILISLMILALLAAAVIPNFRRQNDTQEYQNSIANFKIALKSIQTSYQSGTKCTNSQPTLGWEMVINKSGNTISYFTRCLNSGSTVSLPSATLPAHTTLSSSTCNTTFTQAVLIFNKSGLSYTCATGNSPTYNTFDITFQNSKDTSQVSNLKITQQGVVTE